MATSAGTVWAQSAHRRQRQHEGRYRARIGAQRRQLLVGLLRCGHCGREQGTRSTMACAASLATFVTTPASMCRSDEVHLVRQHAHRRGGVSAEVLRAISPRSTPRSRRSPESRPGECGTRSAPRTCAGTRRLKQRVLADSTLQSSGEPTGHEVVERRWNERLTPR